MQVWMHHDGHTSTAKKFDMFKVRTLVILKTRKFSGMYCSLDAVLQQSKSLIEVLFFVLLSRGCHSDRPLYLSSYCFAYIALEWLLSCLLLFPHVLFLLMLTEHRGQKVYGPNEARPACHSLGKVPKANKVDNWWDWFLFSAVDRQMSNCDSKKQSFGFNKTSPRLWDAFSISFINVWPHPCEPFSFNNQQLWTRWSDSHASGIFRKICLKNMLWHSLPVWHFCSRCHFICAFWILSKAAFVSLNQRQCSHCCGIFLKTPAPLRALYKAFGSTSGFACVLLGFFQVQTEVQSSVERGTESCLKPKLERWVLGWSCRSEAKSKEEERS